jgi:diadenosine tetraphosphate (Ap4A) HIT family hydrolase
VPETPEVFWARPRDALQTPPVQEWETWPFDGELRPRALEPPVEREPERAGVGGVGCRRCERGDEGAMWSDEHWLVAPIGATPGLPMVCILATRAHLDFHELPRDLQRELGPLLVKVQRAVYEIGDIGNVHVCRWGDGSEHFHVWFMARPARVPQLIGSFAAIWDDVLPPLPEPVWQENIEIVRRALVSDTNGV